MVVTFKTFLVEGGKATAKLNTHRATKADVEAALHFVSKHLGLPVEQLKTNLLGSTGHVLTGHKQDAGDVDIAIDKTRHDQDTLVAKLKQATGMQNVHVTGGNVFSFAVPVTGNRKVQTDLVFVPSLEWARFGFHSAVDSAYKGLVRNNYLLDNVLKHTFEPGKDILIRDKSGAEVVRVRRTFGRGNGLYRTFKVAPMRKDGKGRVQLRKGTPAEVERELKALGRDVIFSREVDPILNPDKAAQLLFGQGVKAKDLLSAEQVIKAIFKRKDHAAIFKDVVADFNKNGVKIPPELEKFV